MIWDFQVYGRMEWHARKTATIRFSGESKSRIILRSVYHPCNSVKVNEFAKRKKKIEYDNNIRSPNRA